MSVFQQLMKGVRMDGALFFNGNTTCRVDNVSACLACMVDRVNGGQEKLLLCVRQRHKVLLVSVGLDLRILRDNTSAYAPGQQGVTNREDKLNEPVQGASSNTLSKPPSTRGNSRAS